MASISTVMARSAGARDHPSWLDRWSERLRRHPGVAGAFLALATVSVYAGSLRNIFVFDDEAQIIDNPFILNPHLWTRIFTGSVWSFMSAAKTDFFYRPLQMFCYWLLYRLAGANPSVFHLVQVLVYAATGWIVYRLGCAILENECAAMLGAGLWILHPLHVEAVAYISGMADAGTGFFYLLGFLLFVRAEKRESPSFTDHSFAAMAYFPALFFKEMAISFPLLVLAYWFFYSPRASASPWRDCVGRLTRLLPYIAAIGVYLAIRLEVLGRFGRMHSPWKISSRVVLCAFALLGEHAHLLVWPLRLNPFRTFDLGVSLRSPWPYLAVLALAAAFWCRKRDTPLSFLVAWWAVALAPCLDIRQLSVPQVADRFSYIPSVGPCLALSLILLVRLPARVSGQRVVRIVLPALALLMVFLGTRTVFAIRNWRNDEAMDRNGLAQSPDSPNLHVVRGDLLRFQQGDLDGAEREYQTALSLNDRATVKSFQVAYDGNLGLGAVAQQRGRDEQALDYYRRAAVISPGLSSAYDFLGAYYFPRHDYATAAPYFVRAVSANPQDVTAHIFLANCWMKLGRIKEAVDEFHAARVVDPTLKLAYMGEARSLEALGDTAGAARVRASYHGP
jgi:tetratricopeptide (TPR) repeat protein